MMTKSKQSKLAHIGALLAFGLLIVVGYLAFVFPRTVGAWRDEAEPLSTGAQIAANLSRFCTAHGFVLAALLVAAGIGCFVWEQIAARQAGTEEGDTEAADD